MADVLGNRTYLAGAAITAKHFTFTRSAQDTASTSPTDYTDSDVELVLYNSPTAASPTLTLTVGSGLTKVTNTADVQTVALTISEGQVATLLGAADSVTVAYAWSITPTGGVPIRAEKGAGVNGSFTIEKESRAGS